jgi:glycosyltransferase involved in cell wall biosynthesis
VERSRLAIIIPALNEAGTIGAVIEAISKYGRVLVVDDGSTDLTSAVASAAGALVVRHEVNQGYDRALNSGFARAAALGCEFAITIDADGQHDPTRLEEYVRCLDEGCDVVLGVRDRMQRLAEVIFAFVGRAIWGIADPLCGMKGYRVQMYLRAGAFDTFGSIGTELAVRVVASGGRYREIPLITRVRQDAPRFGRRFTGNARILRALLVLLYKQTTRQLRI